MALNYFLRSVEEGGAQVDVYVIAAHDDCGHKYSLFDGVLRCTDRSCSGSAKVLSSTRKTAEITNKHSANCESAFDHFEMTVFIMTIFGGFCNQAQLVDHQIFLENVPNNIKAVISTAIRVSFKFIFFHYSFKFILISVRSRRTPSHRNTEDSTKRR
jgi:hypothetical protein